LEAHSVAFLLVTILLLARCWRSSIPLFARRCWHGRQECQGSSGERSDADAKQDLEKRAAHVGPRIGACLASGEREADTEASDSKHIIKRRGCDDQRRDARSGPIALVLQCQ